MDINISRRFICIILLACSNIAIAETCGPVVISAHPNYPPFHWYTGQEMTGASIEITGQILDELGIQWQAQYHGPWKRVLKFAEQGQVDIIPALKKNRVRASYLTFTKSPFSYNPVAVFSLTESNLRVDALDDLDGLFGSINLGDRHGQTIDYFIAQQKNFQHIKGIRANFDMLIKKRTNYYIDGYHTGMNYLTHHQLKYKITPIKIFNNEFVHVGFSKKSKCAGIANAFDQRLEQYFNSGKIEKSLAKYEALYLSQQMQASQKLP